MKPPRVIVLGLNRSGTKLAVNLIARAFRFRRVMLEPFTWEGGIDQADQVEWREQLRVRRLSSQGRSEQQRLPIFCHGNEVSPWLSNVLFGESWDVVKLVEIGRCRLYQKLCPAALVVGLIRHPAMFLASLSGAKIQKEALAEQGRRACSELAADPLPDAEKWFPADLANCARAYHVLYTFLSGNKPEGAVMATYEDLVGPQSSLEKVARRLRLPFAPLIAAPRIGNSTHRPLSKDQEAYATEHLQPIYESFTAGT